MRCKQCNIDLSDSYKKCPLCGAAAVNEPCVLQGVSCVSYSVKAPVKGEKPPKFKTDFTMQKLKAFFNL